MAVGAPPLPPQPGISRVNSDRTPTQAQIDYERQFAKWVNDYIISVAGGALPFPTPTTLGGVKSASAPTHQFQKGIDGTGSPLFGQPAAADITGLGPFATGTTVPAASVTGLAAVATSGLASDLIGSLAVGAPTPTTLGGLYSSAAPAFSFTTGVDTSGNVQYRQPTAADLADGTTGTGAVVLANGASFSSPTITNPALSGVSITSGAISGTAFGDLNTVFPGLGFLGSTSGKLILKAAAVAGTNTLTLPGGTTDFSATGGTSQVVKQVSAGAAFTVGQLASSDISGLAASATTDTTNAANISSGTLSVTRLNGLNNVTNTLAADVALNNIATYFTGPTIAQGTSGTWFASGHVTVSDSTAAFVSVKLWDGTTVIASTTVFLTAGQFQCVHLAGRLTSPAGNIRMSVNDSTNTTGNIRANSSGNGADSVLTAFRIG